jgi:hypothetical protein
LNNSTDGGRFGFNRLDLDGPTTACTWTVKGGETLT